MKLLIMQCSPILGPNCSPQHPVLMHLVRVLPLM
jgi:hypothetical protein